MSYRKERLSHVIRDVVSDSIVNRLNDPRISRFTSVTRVEISPDMKSAHVYVSIMGTDTEAKTSMKGLDSARGLIQSRLAKQLSIRQCPIVKFHLDLGIKRAIDTFRQLDQAASPRPEDEVSDEDGASGDFTEDEVEEDTEE